MSFMQRDRWLSTGDVADQLGVTTRTIYRLIDDGELAASRIGRLIKVRESDLTAYLAAAQITPGALSQRAPST